MEGEFAVSLNLHPKAHRMLCKSWIDYKRKKFELAALAEHNQIPHLHSWNPA